jgi:hypothetical protein
MCNTLLLLLLLLWPPFRGAPYVPSFACYSDAHLTPRHFTPEVICNT